MRYLRQNTAIRVTVGPFLDKTDGITPEVALTATNEKITLVVDDGNVPTLVIDANATASGGNNDFVHITGDDAGFYDLELTAAQLNYVGRALLSINYATDHCPVFHEFTILPAQVYDSMVLGSDALQVDTVQIEGADATNTIESGTRAGVGMASANLDTQLSSIASDVSGILSDLPSLVIGQQLVTLTPVGGTGNDTTHIHLENLPYGDDELNNQLLVIYDASALEYHARWIDDWVNSTALATVTTLPFTPTTGDFYYVLSVRRDVTASVGASDIRTAIGLASANLDTQLDNIFVSAGAAAAGVTNLASLLSLFQICNGGVGATGSDSTHIHMDGIAYTNDDDLNEHLVVAIDVSTSKPYARWITDYVGATQLATLHSALPFTFDPGTDEFYVTSIRRDVSGGGGGASASDVWNHLLTSITTTGSVGKLVKDNLDATVSSRSTHSAADVWSVGTRTLTSFGTLVADIWANATRTLTAISDSAGVTTLLSRIAGALTITAGKVDVNDKTGFALTAAYDAAKTAATQTSVDDVPTNAELATALSTLATQTSVNDLPTNAELATALAGADDAVLAAIAALNNLSPSQVQTVITTILSTTTVDANIKQVNDVNITGNGSTTPWGPE